MYVSIIVHTFHSENYNELFAYIIIDVHITNMPTVAIKTYEASNQMFVMTSALLFL